MCAWGLMATLASRLLAMARPRWALVCSGAGFGFGALGIVLGLLCTAFELFIAVGATPYPGASAWAEVFDRPPVLFAATLVSCAPLVLLNRRVVARARRRDDLDATLTGTLFVLAATGVLQSALGGERSTVWALSLLLTLALVVVTAQLVADRVGSKRRVVPALVASVLTFAVIASVAVTHWPLRAAFAWARDSFDDLDRRLRAGERIDAPVHAGALTVRRAEISRQGLVCLWTCLDDSGRTGFVRAAPEGLPVHLWTWTRMDEDWHLVAED